MKIWFCIGSIVGISLMTTVLLPFSNDLQAQSSGGDFTITKNTIDNGGGTSSGGDFSLVGTIGQANANRTVSSGDGFLLAGGFWAKVNDGVFKDSFEND
jgi:hypothetical protein